MKQQLFRPILIAMVLSAQVILLGIPAAGEQCRSCQASSRSAAGQPAFEERFWNWLKSSKYEYWTPWPGQTADFLPAKGPHGPLMKQYVDRQVAGDPANLPHGSIIIVENFGPDQKTVTAISVMYRCKDFDPEHRDWYWAEYDPRGNVARQGTRPLAGKVESCIQCHRSAGGDDFVFANDN